MVYEDTQLAQHDTTVSLARGLDVVMFAGRVLLVTLLFSISPFALAALNWQYFDSGGSFIDKFHPSTLIAFALIGLSIVATRNPFSAAIAFVDRNLDLVPFVFAILFTLVYAAVVIGDSITVFLETFLGAVAMYVLFDGIDDRQRAVIARIIHFLLFVNACLAFYEVATGFRLTPLVVNGELLQDEPRATALMGHPLSNAMVAGAYVVTLALGGAKDLPSPLRIVVFLVALASLIPFGGRAATATALLMLAIVAFRDFVRMLQGHEINTQRLLWGLIIVPVVLFTLGAANEMGWLDTLLARLVEDEGSASTRIVMFDLFQHFTFKELFFGPNPDELMTWVRLYGLEYGIESFVIAFVLHYGILPALFLFPTLFYFLYQLAKATGHRSTGLVVFYFIIVALASVSLSSKSPILSVFVVMVLTLLSGQEREA